MPTESSAVARSMARSQRESLHQDQGQRAVGRPGHRAILGTPDGGQIHCLIEQFSDSGAYLLRSRSVRTSKPLGIGDHVAIHISPRGIHGPDSVTLDGTVTRIESNGPGLAIRFAAVEQEESSHYNDLSSDDWMTEVPEAKTSSKTIRNRQSINFENFGIPEKSANNMPTPAVSIKRVLRYAFMVAFALGSVAVFVLFGDWLGAVVL